MVGRDNKAVVLGSDRGGLLVLVSSAVACRGVSSADFCEMGDELIVTTGSGLTAWLA